MSEQIDGALQVAGEWPSDLLTDELQIIGDKSVQHQSHFAHPWPMSMFLPGSAIELNLFFQLLDGLAKQVGEQVSAHLARRLKCCRAPSRRNPKRQFRLNWTRTNAHLNLLARAVLTDDRFSAP